MHFMGSQWEIKIPRSSVFAIFQNSREEKNSISPSKNKTNGSINIGALIHVKVKPGDGSLRLVNTFTGEYSSSQKVTERRQLRSAYESPSCIDTIASNYP